MIAHARSVPPAGARQDGFADDVFARLTSEIEARSGIKLASSKKSMVEGRLQRRVRALGLPSFAAYSRYLSERRHLEAELEAIINCVTTNKTDFFRENEHFVRLGSQLVPHALTRPERRQGAPLKVWSAASSTGAEAYTLAMVLADLQTRHRFEFAILGTDINTDVLAQARRAVFPVEMRTPVPEAMRRAYTMDAIDPRRREFRIVPELRARVRFKSMNLLDGHYDVDPDFHVIFCRNVLIYFDRDVQKAVVGRLVTRLVPGGHLVLGHSEATAGADHPQLRPLGSAVFERRA